VISGVVLAAGTSSRLGRPKQLLDLRGKPLLGHAVDASLASSLDDVVVVVGHAAAKVRALLPSDPRLRVVENPAFAEGQSTSLRAALVAMDDTVEAAVIVLGDQPGVTSGAIDKVIAEFRRSGGPIVQASYGGTPGHPTLLSREVWPEVDRITGDEGARSIIERRQAQRALVDVGGDPPADIDTEEDYRRARRDFDGRY
jgi:molybdenum cofactor cytidylyltransferase